MTKARTRLTNSPDRPAVGAGAIGWVTLIYFFSGVCSLIDEVVWVRLLKLTLGNTVYASSIVVSVFMGGLAVGALIMSRYADRVARPLRLYAALETLATVSALALPWALRAADAFYQWFFVTYQPSHVALMLVQLLVSAAILLVPSMVMGSTLPLLGRYMTSLGQRVGQLVGRLYALNMLGAALGCGLAGFVLIRAVGVMGTLYIAAGINLAVALAGWQLSRRRELSAGAVAEGAAKARPTAAVEPAGRPRQGLLMAAFFFSGLVSIGYELIWMRSIVFLLGGFTYVFSAVLTLYLLGNVIGAGIGARLAKRLKNPAAAFAVSLTCLGACGVFYLPWLTTWSFSLSPQIAAPFDRLMELLGLVGEPAAAPLMDTTFLFLIPSVIMGVGFPLALQAWGSLRHKVGQTTGTVYGVNTIGAVLGGAIAGFVLIPLLGVQVSITILGIAAVWLGAAMLQTFGSASVSRRLAYLAGAVVLTAAAWWIPSDIYHRRIVTSRGSELLAIREGVTTTVTVERAGDGTLMMSTDGVPIGGNRAFRVGQGVLGHLGPLLNTDAREVLSIGFGTGETTACLAQHDFDRIDCVEIAKEVTQCGLAHFGAINLGHRLSDEVNMMYMDGKNYVRLAPRRYDLILNDADLPTMPGSAPMFAREHFQAGLEHLKPGGLFVSKLHISMVAVSQAGFESIVGTFLDVFPHVTLWFPTTQPYAMMYLVGSREPQMYCPARIDERLRNANVRASAAYLNFRTSQDVLNCYIGDESDIRRYLKSHHVNSDLTPYVEFHYYGLGLKTTAEQNRYVHDVWLPRFFETVRGDSLSGHIDRAEMSDRQFQQWQIARRRNRQASTYALRSFVENDPFRVLQNCFDGLSLVAGYPVLLEQEDMALSDIDSALGADRSGRVAAAVAELLRNRPKIGSGWLVKSWDLRQHKDLPGALDAGEKAVRLSPRLARARDNLAGLFMMQGSPGKAAEHWAEATRLRPTDMRLRYNLAVALKAAGRLDQAVVTLRELVSLEPRSAMARFALAEVYLQQGNRDQAVAEYREVLRINPQLEQAKVRLGLLVKD